MGQERRRKRVRRGRGEVWRRGAGLDLGGAGELEGLHQLVELLQHGRRAQLGHPGEEEEGEKRGN